MKLSLSDQVEHLKRQIKSKERDLMHSNDVGYNMGLATAIDLVNAVFGSPTAEDEVAALPNTEQDLLRQAQESVCSLLCPSKWKTGERQPHSNLCRQITASLGATDEEVPQVQDAVVPEQRMVSQSEVPIESVDCLWPQATIQDRKRSGLPMLIGSGTDSAQRSELLNGQERSAQENSQPAALSSLHTEEEKEPLRASTSLSPAVAPLTHAAESEAEVRQP